VTTAYPPITQVPLPPGLTGLSVSEARRALRDPALRDACLSGRPGAEIQAWACNYAISQLHADHLVTTAIAVAAASQAGRLTPEQAWSRLRDAVNLGDRPEIIPLDPSHYQIPDDQEQASVHEALDPDPDLLPRFIADVLTLTVAPTKPDPPVVAVLAEAAIAAETILGQHRLSLAGLPALDEDAAANAIRIVAREWPADIPAAARRLVAGTTSRSASAVSRITFGPVALALSRITTTDPRTIRRWGGWYRSLAPITQRIAA